MVHNGVEYGIMQAYAEGLTYSKRQMQEEVMWWKAMLRSLPMSDPENYQYDIDVSEVAWLLASWFCCW